MEVLIQKISNHVPCRLANELVYVDEEFTKPIVVFRDENGAYEVDHEWRRTTSIE